MVNISFDELKEAAEPLLELLREKGHMHMMVIVEQDSVRIVETVMGLPDSQYDMDRKHCSADYKCVHAGTSQCSRTCSNYRP